jgi:hypothetical protein
MDFQAEQTSGNSCAMMRGDFALRHAWAIATSASEAKSVRVNDIESFKTPKMVYCY